MTANYPSIPNKSHGSLKFFLLLTGILSLISLACNSLSLPPLFYLSRQGLNMLYLWQPLSSLFIIPGTIFSFFYLLNLGLKIVMMWSLSHFLIEKKGLKRFWLTLGITMTFIALCATGSALIFPSFPPFSGNALIIASLAVGYFVWSSPKLKLPIPLHFSLQGRWIMLTLLLLFLVTESLHNELSYYLILGTQLIGSYLLEKHLFKNGSSKKSPSSLFFKTQKAIESISPSMPYDDEAFIEAALSKISLYGKKALTIEEKKRMEIISIKKEITRDFPF